MPAVANFVKRGLEQQETVILIATAEHRADLTIGYS